MEPCFPCCSPCQCVGVDVGLKPLSFNTEKTRNVIRSVHIASEAVWCSCLLEGNILTRSPGRNHAALRADNGSWFGGSCASVVKTQAMNTSNQGASTAALPGSRDTGHALLTDRFSDHVHNVLVPSTVKAAAMNNALLTGRLRESAAFNHFVGLIRQAFYEMG
ncbi:hypothetical protein HAX54_037640 [Datura stramonium]|uniref:Uncharacterized protein n=1 Tax=Datura stramonium TaxID=4076 RepID=A0ABS8VLT9_DATST|nr:hypothetical protein [Datura stramonium]